MAYLYGIMFLIAILLLVILVPLVQNQNGVTYVLLFATTVVTNFGYFMLALSGNIDEAVLANRITYFDGCFLALFIFLSVTKLCNIRIPSLLIAGMVVVSLGVFGLACSVGYSDIYYQDVQYHNDNGIVYLTKEYGPAHGIYLAMLIIYMISPLIIIAYSAFHRKRVSFYNTLFLGISEVTSIIIYFGEQLFDSKVELLPISYIVSEIFILIMIRRINMYDVSRNVANEREKRSDIGYVTFDTELRYLGSDASAKRYFPEIDELLIDYPISSNNSEFLKQITHWVNDNQKEDERATYFEREGRSLRCSLKSLNNGRNKRVGYYVEIVDDTDNQEHIRILNELNDKLEQAVKDAEAANRAKSDFLANMSHEIRTPINSVLGMNEMILRECREPQILEYATNIDNSGSMLLSLINDILDFSKIESGKMDIVPTDYHVSSVLNDLVMMISPRAKKKGLEFWVEANPDIPYELYGDEMRIRQIMTNLLTNAVKYSDTGSITLVVDYEEVEADGFRLILSVKDTGRGIRKEDQERLFESFQRVDEKKNSNIEGTGLGLAITSKFVEMMNGKIELSSTYGVGSTFTVKIPQKVVTAVAMGDFQEQFEKSTKESSHYQEDFTAPEAKVLVVDDNQMNLMVAAHLLKATQVQVTTASGGREALALLRENDYDVILLDHMMPEMDGVETLHHIHDECLAETKPIIALTANAVSGAREMYMDYGFQDYLAKPIIGKDLEKLLVKWLPESKVTYL